MGKEEPRPVLRQLKWSVSRRKPLTAAADVKAAKNAPPQRRRRERALLREVEGMANRMCDHYINHAQGGPMPGGLLGVVPGSPSSPLAVQVEAAHNQAGCIDQQFAPAPRSDTLPLDAGVGPYIDTSLASRIVAQPGRREFLQQLRAAERPPDMLFMRPPDCGMSLRSVQVTPTTNVNTDIDGSSGTTHVCHTLRAVSRLRRLDKVRESLRTAPAAPVVDSFAGVMGPDQWLRRRSSQRPDTVQSARGLPQSARGLPATTLTPRQVYPPAPPSRGRVEHESALRRARLQRSELRPTLRLRVPDPVTP
eukprot:Hpha_TRINITY_DN15641_c0_g4::TRINITY_DN15641_c0_g4_i1::g.98168::m.98168